MDHYSNFDYNDKKILKKNRVSRDSYHPLYHTFTERHQFFNEENEYAYFLGMHRMQLQNIPEKLYENYPALERFPLLPPHQIKDEEKIIFYLERGIAYEEAFIDAGIFCVLNVSDHLSNESKQTYRTLVFYEDGLIIKTMESSNQIMNRIFQQNGIPYEKIRFIIKSLEGKPHHCSPYVLGNVSFLPLRGPIKKDVTWISLGHLTSFHKISGSGTHIRLDFKNRHTLDAEMSMEAFQRHMDTAGFLYTCQYNILKKASQFFGMNIVPHERSRFNSLLSKNYQTSQHKPTYTLEDILLLMMLSLWQEISKEDPFKENPLVEEINEFIARRYPKDL